VIFDSHTGDNAYRVKPGNPLYGPTTDLTMTYTGKYMLSCWIKTEAGYGTGYLVAHTSAIGSPGVVYPVNAESYKTTPVTNTNGKWQYFEAIIDVAKARQLSGVSGALNIRAYVYNTDASHGFLVDDMKLHPLNARMSNYTHSPLVGMTSQTDANNNEISTYQYDSFSRLLFEQDKDGNVVKKYCYNYVGQSTDCQPPIFSSITTFKPFVKSDCPGGAQGSTVLFTIPSGMFTSYISYIDADLKAQSYLNTYGQEYANATGTCPNSCPNCTGNDKKCINGVCETGLRVETFCEQVTKSQRRVTYHYEFSDGSWSTSYTELGSGVCEEP